MSNFADAMASELNVTPHVESVTRFRKCFCKNLTILTNRTISQRNAGQLSSRKQSPLILHFERYGILDSSFPLNAEYAPLLERIKRGPGDISSNSTKPYWLQDPPFPELVDTRSDKLLEEADIVIIGSGITGASIAWNILEEVTRKDKNLSLVVLEARETCSGATGRNGGHIKPSPYQLFHILSQRHTAEEAAQVVRFQRTHIDCLIDLCDKEGFDVAECRKVETCDLFLDEKEFKDAIEMVSLLHKHMPEISVAVLNPKEAQRKCGTNEKIYGAIVYEAGAIWPYRLVTSVWNKLLSKYSKHLRLETKTPVESITVGTSPERPFVVTTARGNISASHIVHATNAFASQLLPQLRSKMTGIRAHMSAHTSGPSFPDTQGARSWSFVYPKGYDYLTQRPGQNGDLMLGGGFSIGARGGLDNVAIWEDDKIDTQTEAYLRGIMPAIFQKPDSIASDISVCKQVWSGIVSVTGDFLPFVGRIDSKISSRKPLKRPNKLAEDIYPGEWIAAGYMGDGMVYAWLSGAAVAIQILGYENEDLPSRPGFPGGQLASWFPTAMHFTSKRVNRCDIMDIADML